MAVATTYVEEAFEKGILDRDIHNRFIMNVDEITSRAGVPRAMVFARLSSTCKNKEEIRYIKNLREKIDGDTHGLVYMGDKLDAKNPVHTRMMAIASHCLRNFTEAKVMTVQEVLVAMKANTMPDPTVLLVPNFYMQKNDGGNIADWQVPDLLSMLIRRQGSGRQTLLYVSDMDQMGKEYGLAIKDLIKRFYVKIIK